MSRIQKRLTSLNGKKALVAFFTAGDPDLNASKDIFSTIETHGADIVEIGVPFSDPLADGPTIQASSHRSLKNGTTLKKIIQLVIDIRKKSELPVILMTSFNPIFVYGQKDFIADVIKAGVDGLIIPDLPPEEAESFLDISEGLDIIFLLAPTSTADRIQEIGEISKGFVYYISLTGTTGTKESITVGLNEKVSTLYPSELSGGMQKRVGLARAIANSPEIIFFDEPTEELDILTNNQSKILMILFCHFFLIL